MPIPIDSIRYLQAKFIEGNLNLPQDHIGTTLPALDHLSQHPQLFRPFVFDTPPPRFIHALGNTMTTHHHRLGLNIASTKHANHMDIPVPNLDLVELWRAHQIVVARTALNVARLSGANIDRSLGLSTGPFIQTLTHFIRADSPQSRQYHHLTCALGQTLHHPTVTPAVETFKQSAIEGFTHPSPATRSQKEHARSFLYRQITTAFNDLANTNLSSVRPLFQP